MIKRQLETAESTIWIATKNWEVMEEFFLEDQTWAILCFPYEAGKDPHTAALSLRSGDGSPLEVSLLRTKPQGGTHVTRYKGSTQKPLDNAG